jgi:hypothetical protein
MKESIFASLVPVLQIRETFPLYLLSQSARANLREVVAAAYIFDTKKYRLFAVSLLWWCMIQCDVRSSYSGEKGKKTSFEAYTGFTLLKYQ